MGKKVGPYELRREIGKGSFGVVYLGKHMPSKNKIAVKMINRQKLNEETQARLQQEIMCQRSVENDNIVKLIDIQKTDNNFYLILEYCAGGDLSAYIKDQGPVEESVAQRWMQQLAIAFQALRSKNIIHRDLKLSNILMTEASPNAILKLADFGMSRFLEGENLAASCLGTPLYMAPEVIRPIDGYGEKADIWSLGMVFFEMLTGEPPFIARRRDEIAMAQRDLKPIPENLSPLCKDLLAQMLEHNHANRISFQGFFEHPFIGKPDDNSIKASKGSSALGSVSSLGLTPSKEESKSNIFQDNEELIEQEEDEEDDDEFVLLETDSCNDFVFVAKDSHPAVDLNEESNSLEVMIEVAELVQQLADKIKATNEVLGSFALQLKAAWILYEAYDKSSELIKKHQLAANTHPAFYELHNRIKQSFKEKQQNADKQGDKVEVLAATNIEQLTGLKSVSPQGIADTLIYNYAINLCKEAAEDEFLRDYENSKIHYTEASALLDLIYQSRDEEYAEQWNLINNLRNETRKRLDLVIVKLGSPEQLIQNVKKMRKLLVGRCSLSMCLQRILFM